MVLDPRRAGDVTASDIPAIVGECPYSNRRAQLLKKVYNIKTPNTAATLHGQKYEPIAIKKFEETTSSKVSYPGYRKHEQFKFIGGTVDGIAKFADGTSCVIEVKCPVSRPIEDEIPTHYIGQVQTYLFIFNMPYALFVQYKPAGKRSAPEKFVITKIDRDYSYIGIRLPCLYRFWLEMIYQKEYVNHITKKVQRTWRQKTHINALIRMQATSKATIALWQHQIYDCPVYRDPIPFYIEKPRPAPFNVLLI